MPNGYYVHYTLLYYKLCTFPGECIYLIHVILKININYFLDFCNVVGLIPVR
jgi:hypothetical protein